MQRDSRSSEPPSDVADGASAPLTLAVVPADDSRRLLSHDRLEIAAKVLAFTTILLPAGGFLARAIAFEIAFPDSGWGVALAWSAPLPQLAVTGFASLLVALPVALGLWLMWNAEVISVRPPAWLGRHRWLKALFLLALGVGLLAGLIVNALLFVFLPFWPTSLVSFGLAIFLILARPRSWRDKEKRRLRDVWWVVAVGVFGMNVSAGVLGILIGFGPGEYQFVSGASQLTNGTYQQIGEADGIVYLQKCGSDIVYGVNELDVVAMQTPATRWKFPIGPSLYDVYHGATPQLGFQAC
jgi:hypothetical protein